MFRNLAAEKARYGVTSEQMGVAIGKSKDAVDKKMTGEVDWRLKEMINIRNEFFPNCSLDYLYAQGVENAQEGA